LSTALARTRGGLDVSVVLILSDIPQFEAVAYFARHHLFIFHENLFSYIQDDISEETDGRT